MRRARILLPFCLTDLQRAFWNLGCLGISATKSYSTVHRKHATHLTPITFLRNPCLIHTTATPFTLPHSPLPPQCWIPRATLSLKSTDPGDPGMLLREGLPTESNREEREGYSTGNGGLSLEADFIKYTRQAELRTPACLHTRPHMA